MRLALLTVLLAATTPVAAAGLADIAGDWVVDLRVAPTDAPYSKPMTLVIAPDKLVTGSFYESEIIDGRASAGNSRVCVAFKTSDGRGLYQTSGCLIDGRIVGQSWSEQRKFLLNWTATRRP